MIDNEYGLSKTPDLNQDPVGLSNLIIFSIKSQN